MNLSDNLIIVLMSILASTLVLIITKNLSDLKKIRRLQDEQEFAEEVRYKEKRQELESKILEMQKEIQRGSDTGNRLIFEGQEKHRIKEFNSSEEKRNLLYLTPINYDEQDVNENDIFYSEINNFSRTSIVVEKTVEGIGFKFLRSDRETKSNIFEHIIKLIESSRYIVVNIDGKNPNVFYELGYCHALGKETILISNIEEKEKVPFDIQQQRIIFYSDYSDLKEKLTYQLGNRLIDRV